MASLPRKRSASPSRVGAETAPTEDHPAWAALGRKQATRRIRAAKRAWRMPDSTSRSARGGGGRRSLPLGLQAGQEVEEGAVGPPEADLVRAVAELDARGDVRFTPLQVVLLDDGRVLLELLGHEGDEAAGQARGRLVVAVVAQPRDRD